MLILRLTREAICWVGLPATLRDSWPESWRKKYHLLEGESQIFQAEQLFSGKGRVLVTLVGEITLNDRILEELDIRGLRASFLEFTRAAFGEIPRLESPRILDIGCGSGAATIELAGLSDGRIDSIDPDEDALETLRSRIGSLGLSDRVRIRCCSIFETGFAAGTFDIVWEEGVFHLLDAGLALAEAARLVKGGGYLVMFETDIWIDETIEHFEKYDFVLHHRLRLPVGAWWTNYYEPLEERVARMRKRSQGPEAVDALERFEREIREVKADVSKTACSFLIMRRSKH